MGLVRRLFRSLFRSRGLPAAARPPLDRDERVVAWAPDSVVVTNRGIWVPSSGGPARRIGWHEIHKASWSGRQLTLVPAEVVADLGDFVVVADLPPVTVVLADPGRVPDQVRTRVNRSIAYTAHHPAPGLRVVARRVPGVDGLRWTVRYDVGVDGCDPAVQAAVASLVAQARAAVL